MLGGSEPKNRNSPAGSDSPTTAALNLQGIIKAWEENRLSRIAIFHATFTHEVSEGIDGAT